KRVLPCKFVLWKQIESWLSINTVIKIIVEDNSVPNNAMVFLLLNLVLGFYNAGVIWAHEMDIFMPWKLIDKKDFDTVQLKHWKKLPYWVFIPVGQAIAGSVGLIWYHSAGSPPWAI